MTDQFAETSEPAAQDSAALDDVLVRYQPDPAPSGDLDNLLAEYDQQTRAAIDRSARDSHEIGTLDELFDERHIKLREQAAYSARTAEEAQQRIDQLKSYEQQLAQKQFQEKHERDLSQLIKTVRSDDIDSERFPDEIVQAWIDAQATKNPAWQTAWLQRLENPAAWGRVEGELCRAFSKSAMSVIDPALTEDRDMVAAAVRGASINRAPEERPPSYGRMSNSDFKRDVQDRYGFDPGI